jgi:hypothetical protein
MNVTLAITRRPAPVKVAHPGAAGMAKGRPNATDSAYNHMSTMFDSNRERISGAVKNSLHTGADLRAALTGSTPPDDAFVKSIAEAMSM